MYTKEQQARHCDMLANLLNSRKVSEYNHGTYYMQDFNGCGTVACALGWASMAHIGGLRLSENQGSNHRSPNLLDEDNRAIGPLTAANLVFGDRAFEEIFSSSRSMETDKTGLHVDDWPSTDDNGRADSIRLLRERSARLRAEATTEAAMPA